MDFSKLIERAKAMLLTPKTEWPVVAGEATTSGEIYRNYVIVLAAIPAIAGFIKMAVFGVSVPFAGTIRVGMMSGLSTALLTYVMSIVGVFVMALIVNALAPSFGAEKNPLQALKVVAYSFTAAWVAGVGDLLPGLGTLLALAGAVYSIYLLYLGLPQTMKCPAEKAGAYTAVTVIVAIVLGIVMGMVVGGATGFGTMFGRGGLPRSVESSDVRVDPDSPLGKLETWSKNVEAAGKKMEEAQKSGDSKAAGEALGGVLGAALGGSGARYEALPVEQIKGFLPDALGDLKRTSISAERNAAMGLQISKAEARYGTEGGSDVDVEITDLGGAQGLMLLAAWANVESEKQTDSGYERTRRDGGRIVHEEWNNADQRGEYSIVLGERFVAKVAGRAGSLDELKALAGRLDLSGLEALKSAGAKAN